MRKCHRFQYFVNYFKKIKSRLIGLHSKHHIIVTPRHQVVALRSNKNQTQFLECTNGRICFKTLKALRK